MAPRGQDYIKQRIPHRDPFLWLDDVVELDAQSIVASKQLDRTLELFKGHYPDYPLMPGVILCEAVFQAGALLISENIRRQQAADQENCSDGVPVLTRIQGAKFKREVHPGDTIMVSAMIKEVMGGAWFLKGNVKVHGKLAVQVEFSCALKREQ